MKHLVKSKWLLAKNTDNSICLGGSYHKENVQCYGNSCIQCFPCKKTLYWANVCFSEYGYFKTEL